MTDRRSLRRMFLSALKAEGLDYVGGGCQVAHPSLTWSISLVVDGAGSQARYRLVLGGSVPDLGSDAPRDAENCPLALPLAYESSSETTAGASPPRLPDAVFPESSGTHDARASAIARCVADVVRYARQVNLLDELRTHYSTGEYQGAFIIGAPP